MKKPMLLIVQPCEPDAYHPEGAPPGVDWTNAGGFLLTAAGPEGGANFFVTFPNPVPAGRSTYSQTSRPAFGSLNYREVRGKRPTHDDHAADFLSGFEHAIVVIGYERILLPTVGPPECGTGF